MASSLLYDVRARAKKRGRTHNRPCLTHLRSRTKTVRRSGRVSFLAQRSRKALSVFHVGVIWADAWGGRGGVGGGRFTIVVGRVVSVWQSCVSSACARDDDDDDDDGSGLALACTRWWS